jgi:tRNA G46 methylase TrmB
MQADSREIYSNQTGVHDNLEQVVLKHLRHPFLKPPAEHTRQAFTAVNERISAAPAPLILDSCCGTGVSSRQIALQHPDSWVIGLDRSAKRLDKEYEEALPDNLLMVQADCVDFWKLAVEAGWQLQKHYLLYPNPYPKSVQLKYRWHGHPAFADLLRLGGLLEVRSNWQLYIEEFSQALKLAEQATEGCEVIDPAGQYLTLFERKYCQSGQTVYRCLSTLSFRNTG